MKRKLLCWLSCCAALMTFQTQAIVFDSFGPRGEGGAKNGQSLLIGQGGSVYELDSFLYIQGLDLNGSRLGTAAQLSRDTLPAGLAYAFSSSLSTNHQDLVLTYSFTNSTASTFSDLRFFVLLDADIDEQANTFFNEFGTVQGAVGHGAGDAAPDQWQIDEPGFQTGTLLRNIFLGSLNNSNAIPQITPDDVALSLGFSLGSLKSGQATSVQVMISEATNSPEGFALIHKDSAADSPTTITLSGSAVVNELPFINASNYLHLSFSQWQLNYSTGSLIGTLSIQNSTAGGVTFGPPYQLGLPTSVYFYLPHPGGVLSDGVPYLDLTAAVNARIVNGLLAPGQTVVLTNGVEVYSLTRTPPTNTLFEIWATPQ